MYTHFLKLTIQLSPVTKPGKLTLSSALCENLSLYKKDRQTKMGETAANLTKIKGRNAKYNKRERKERQRCKCQNDNEKTGVQIEKLKNRSKERKKEKL